MIEPRSLKRVGRSIAAVLIGIAAGVAVTVSTDFALHAIRLFPPWGQRVPDGLLLLATGYRTVYSIAASYLTAVLAPYRPLRHALAGGVAGLLVNAAGTIATWNGGPAYQPHWYPIALIVLALPSAWLGGSLLERQLSGAGVGLPITRR
jgi:hypothetical protein